MPRLAALVACTAVCGWSSLVQAAEAPPDYNRDVAPLFRKYCVACHASDEPEKGLVLESYAALLKGGQSGAAIVPGRGDESRLLRMLDGRAKPAMPPKDNEAPTAAEIALLRRWIDAGAPGPAGATPDPTILITPRIAPRVAAPPGISAAAVSPDGKLMALAGYGSVRLVTVEGRATVRSLTKLRGSVAAVSFSADGALLLTAAGEPGLFGEAQLWRVADGALVRTFTGHKDSLYAAVLSPDGKRLATGSYDQQIKLWDAATGAELKTLAGHNGAVFDLAFSPNGKILASASADRTVKLWDVASGTRLDTFSQPLKDVTSVAFTPDGKRVVAASADSRIRVWNLSPSAKENTNPLVITRFAHEGAVLRIAFSKDGKTLASAGEDRMVRLWDTRQFTERRILAQQPDWAPALALGPDNVLLLVGRLDGSYALYNAADGQLRAVTRPELAALEPRGVQRGTKTKVRLTGKHLAGASRLTIGGAGVKPEAFTLRLLPTGNTAEEAWAEITPAATAPRGPALLAIVTEGGTSTELPLYVDDIPQQLEAEPNNAAPGLKPGTLPLASWGTIDRRGDLDHVRFAAKKGQTIVVELSAKRIGSSLNAQLTLLDPAGEVVANNNDFDNQSDPLVAYTVPADGTYAARVQDLTLSGSAAHYYRLSIGTFAYVTGVYPLGVPTGRETAVSLVGYNLPAQARAMVAPKAAGEVPVPLDANLYRAGRVLKVLASDDPELVEQEPNDVPATATPIVGLSAGGVAHANGRIWPAGPARSDVDLYRFESRQGETWIIETEAARRSSPVDTRIEVLHADGRPVERLLLQAVLDSYITFRPISSDVPDARVKNWEEMSLNQYLYMQGEVCKIFRMPQGPDSGFQFYASGGKRRDYFDTSATAHAMDEPCYIVEPHPVGTKLIPNGLPQVTVYYANDDDPERRSGSDSRLTFTAPADGSYLVRVTDVRDFSGDRFAYRLSIHRPRPDFVVRASVGKGLTVNAGSGAGILFTADRVDGYDGDIRVEVAGLPAGFEFANPVVIQAGHSTARGVLAAAVDAKPATAAAWSKVRITATAQIDGQPVTRSVPPWSAVKLGPKPQLLVRMEPAEIRIAPGQTVRAMLKIDRQGYEGAVAFDVDNLPHGVIVDNIGLNGILIPEGKNERELFLSAADWVPETDRPCFAESKNFRASNAGAQASRAVMLHVRAAPVVAEAAEK